ncbi:MAG: hypothetical protein F4Z15_00745 [Gammaproteobacteria bacterium]|nr:hypothetical protein [Gammaproteobacteria bacterium]
MSQSEQHHRLVITTALAIEQRYPKMEIISDLIGNPGESEPVPPLIGGYRPDIIARSNSTFAQIVIAEAKTDHDIDRQHTNDQISAFVDYLDSLRRGAGTFILSVNGQAAGQARTVLNFNFRKRVTPYLAIKLFDGQDFWTLGSPEETLWCLS